jgi:hypothetical protein
VTAFNHCRPFLPMLKECGTPIWVDLHDHDAGDRHRYSFIDVADGLLMSSTAMPDRRRFLERRVAAGTGIGLCTHGSAGAGGLSAQEGWVDVPAARSTRSSTRTAPAMRSSPDSSLRDTQERPSSIPCTQAPRRHPWRASRPTWLPNRSRVTSASGFPNRRRPEEDRRRPRRRSSRSHRSRTSTST